MNNVIDEVNSNGWFEVSEDLKLDVEDKADLNLKKKLNELHYIFESKSIPTMKKYNNKIIVTPLFRALESMNNLVPRL